MSSLRCTKVVSEGAVTKVAHLGGGRLDVLGVMGSTGSFGPYHLQCMRFQVLGRDFVDCELKRAILRARIIPRRPTRVPRGIRDVALYRGGPLAKSAGGASRRTRTYERPETLNHVFI